MIRNPKTAEIQILKKAAEPIFRAMEVLEPDQFYVFFCALVANLAGNCPDDYWEGVKANIQPCGQTECTCHLEAKALFDALEPMRLVHKKITSGNTN